VSKEIYVWGYNNVDNRLGIARMEETDEPVVLKVLNEILEKKKDARQMMIQSGGAKA
jgi:hypothetical protein